MALTSGTRLGPYEILAPLGAGGMGEVYRARDRKLDRDVAIKVLPESVAAEPDRLARFEREAKAVAALSHPNILAIHDFGSHEGVAYAVTELLEGETLRARLAAGPIPQRQAVDYALQIARGLSAAHEKGIVHRDLKPENVFVTRDGHVKILDFGLAKRTERILPEDVTSAPTQEQQTEPGTVIGTVGYMSPEQVRGLPVDHLSDIFSFGAVLYEMLSGKRAFQGHTHADTMSAILKEEPPELSGSGRTISPALDHIVRHCLEKNRENRFQSVKDIAFALSEASAPMTATHGVLAVAAPGGRRPVLVAAAVVVVVVSAGVGVLLMRRAPHVSGPAGGAKRMAVLPFENLGAPGDDYFADGMADEIRGKLTSLPGIQVIARASSTPYKKTNKTPRQIAEELGVGYLLTATVRWERAGGGSRVLVSPELIDVSGSGAPTSKWQQPFDTPLTDVFRVQADIAERVAQALEVALGSGEQKGLSQGPTKNLAAYDAFLRGEETSDGMAAFDPPTQRRALAFYEQAVALDPEFAQAWAQVARARAYLYYSSVPAPDLGKRAREAGERAVALAPKRAEGYLAVGDQERLVAKDNVRALAQYERAGSLAPGNAQVLTATASAEQSLGRWEAAVEHLSEAKHLDPRSVQAHLFLGGAFLCLRRYPEALSTIDRGLAIAPANFGLIGTKVQTFLAQGDLTAARTTLKAATTKSNSAALVAYMANFGDLVWVLDEPQERFLLTLPPAAFDDDLGTWGICLAQACALRGDSLCLRSHADEAALAYEKQLATSPQDAQRRVFHGLALAYLGRKDEAVRDGELAAELNPVAKDAVTGPYVQHQLVRIYVLVGELEKALDQLEPLLKTPYWLSPGWLKIDPNFDPLRKNPRFQKLVAETK